MIRGTLKRWINREFRNSIENVKEITYGAKMDDIVSSINVGLTIARQGFIRIPKMDLIVTTHCNLQCKQCTQWNPYLPHKKIMKYDDIVFWVTKLLQRIDVLENCIVLGGEPFLNHELAKIITWLCKQEKILRIQVVTNGTIEPSREIVESCKNKKVKVCIDAYDNSNSIAQKVAWDFISAGVVVDYDAISEWRDFGFYSEKITPIECGESNYENCIISDCTTFIDGKLYRCPRCYALELLEKIRPEDNNCIDINSVKNKKEMLKEVIRFYGIKELKACRYCNPTIGEKVTYIEVAEQLGR